MSTPFIGMMASTVGMIAAIFIILLSKRMSNIFFALTGTILLILNAVLFALNLSNVVAAP